MMADAADLRKRLFEEMKGRIKEDDSSVPMKDGPFAYGSSYKKGGEQPRFFRTSREGGTEEIILDGDAEADGQAYFRIGGSDHSSDHRRLLWSYDDKGSEFYSLRVRDLATGKDLGYDVPDTSGGGVWNAVERRLPLHAGRREPPPVQAVLPRARERRLAGSACLRGKRPGLLHGCRRLTHQRVDIHLDQRPRDF